MCQVSGEGRFAKANLELYFYMILNLKINAMMRRVSDESV